MPLGPIPLTPVRVATPASEKSTSAFWHLPPGAESPTEEWASTGVLGDTTFADHSTLGMYITYPGM